MELQQERLERAEERRLLAEELAQRANGLNGDHFPAPNPSYDFAHIQSAWRQMREEIAHDDEDNAIVHQLEFETILENEHGILHNQGLEDAPEDLIHYGMCPDEDCERWGPVGNLCPLCGSESDFKHVSYYAQDED